MTARILVVDDDLEVGKFFTNLLKLKGHKVTVAANGSQAREAFKEAYHLAIFDLKLPDTDGLTLFREMKACHPGCEILVMTGYSTVKSAVEAVQLGAFDYLEKPFSDLTELEAIIDRALIRSSVKGEANNEQRKQILDAIGLITGRSEKMQRLLLTAEKLSQKNITLLIRGETGSGKELLARFIHATGPRASKPFLAINCGALPENLLESELFGYEKGAFTGAYSQRKGIFELAHGGTLFLDEIGDASAAIQVKLLRVLETGEILRIGGEKPLQVDVRIIAATNADLEDLVKRRRFREDLFYRLDVVTLTVPPLRERREDIYLLAEYFLARHYPAARLPQLSLEVVKILKYYHWPGNVRELANVMAQVAAVCDGPTVLPEHLSLKVLENESIKGQPDRALSQSNYIEEWSAELKKRLADFTERIDINSGFNLPQFLTELKQIEIYAAGLLIERALKETKGRYPAAAKLLKTTPRVLHYLKKEKH